MFLSKHKNGRYYIYYNDPITGGRKSISTSSKLKSEANVFMSNFRDQIKNRKEKQIIEITLKGLRWEFLKHSEAVHTPGTTKGFKSTFEFFNTYFGELTKLSELSRKQMREYLQHRMKKSSVYQARKDLIHLSSVFNWAIENRFLNTSPTQSIKRIKIPEKQPLFFSEDEFDAVLKNIPHEDIRDLVVFAVNTGLRQMELLTLEWTQINFEQNYLILDNRSHLTKSKKVRSVPLNDIAMGIIINRQLGNRSQLVFTYYAKVIKPNFISKQFKKAVRKAKINDRLCFHSLRHSFASWLVQKGTPIYVIKELLGHQSISTTEIYSHLRSEDLRNAVKLINKR